MPILVRSILALLWLVILTCTALPFIGKSPTAGYLWRSVANRWLRDRPRRSHYERHDQGDLAVVWQREEHAPGRPRYHNAEYDRVPHPLACTSKLRRPKQGIGYRAKLTTENSEGSARLRPGQEAQILLHLQGIHLDHPVRRPLCVGACRHQRKRVYPHRIVRRGETSPRISRMGLCRGNECRGRFIFDFIRQHTGFRSIRQESKGELGASPCSPVSPRPAPAQ